MDIKVVKKIKELPDKQFWVWTDYSKGAGYGRLERAVEEYEKKFGREPETVYVLGISYYLEVDGE